MHLHWASWTSSLRPMRSPCLLPISAYASKILALSLSCSYLCTTVHSQSRALFVCGVHQSGRAAATECCTKDCPRCTIGFQPLHRIDSLTESHTAHQHDCTNARATQGRRYDFNFIITPKVTVPRPRPSSRLTRSHHAYTCYYVCCCTLSSIEHVLCTWHKQRIRYYTIRYRMLQDAAKQQLLDTQTLYTVSLSSTGEQEPQSR